MLGEKHLLSTEFPEYSSVIHDLKSTDPEFMGMSKRYHQLDHKIRGLELNKVPTTDEHFSTLKLERAELKDKLYRILVSNGH